MPMIEVTTSEKINKSIADQIKKGLGENIVIFPGKPEARAMVSIKDQAYMYFGGKEGPTALISVALYLEQPEETYTKYSKIAVETITKVLPQIPRDRIYVKYQTLTHKNWGKEFE